MSLPVVSYGRYNYGQYSNPTPIRFTGGIGAGIAQGVTTGVKEIVRQTQEKRKKEDAANLASAKAQIQFQAATDAYLKSATEENRAFLIQQKQLRGETERLFALKQISLDDYTKRVSASQGLLSQLKQLSGLVTDLSKINNGQDIDDLQLRNNKDAFDANIKLQALVDGKFKIKGNYEDGFDIELPMYQSAMGTGEEIKEYAVGDIPLTQLLQNTKLYTPELAYVNAANPNLNKLKDDLKKDIVTQGFTVFNDVEGDKEQEFIDINKKNEINQFLLNTKGDAILSTLDAKQKRIYYEDNIKKELGSWTGSEEQIQELKSTLVNEITDEFAGVAIGSKINKRKESDARVFEIKEAKIRKTIADTAGQRKNIADNYANYITFDSKNRITNYSKFKKQLQGLGIRTGSEFGDDDGVHTIELIGLGYRDTIDFRTMDSTTMSIILENLQGAMELAEPATGLP